jgi:hypothetical protein
MMVQGGRLIRTPTQATGDHHDFVRDCCRFGAGSTSWRGAQMILFPLMTAWLWLKIFTASPLLASAAIEESNRPRASKQTAANSKRSRPMGDR